MAQDKKTKRLVTLLPLVTVGATILIVKSFSSLKYYEMAFIKSTTTGRVDTSNVYREGRFFIGIASTFKKFRADAHVENFKSLSFFNKERLEVKMACSLQYYLIPAELKFLHATYDLGYRPILRKTLITTLKSEATKFTVNEYRLERPKVEAALLSAVRVVLGGTCARNTTVTNACTVEERGLFSELRYFQLGLVSITAGQAYQFLRQVTAKEKKDTEEFKQKEMLTRKETLRLRRVIENEALEISQNATAQASLVRSKASVDASAVLADAMNSGLQIIFNTLNITKADHKKSFDYLRTLLHHTKSNMYLGFNTIIGKP